MPKLSENELIDALQKGDEAAYRLLIHKYNSMIQNVIYKMVEDQDDTKDLSQEVWIRIWKSIGKFRRKSSLQTWIYRISIHSALNHIRKKQRLRLVSFSHSDALESTTYAESPIASGFDKMDQHDQAAIISSALNRLTAKQKAAFILSNAEGLSNAETAEVLETSVSAVESLLIRAKRKLKQELSNSYLSE